MYASNVGILYLDTSALVKLYVPEAGSEFASAEARAAGTLATAIVTYAEARSAFASMHRNRRLGAAALTGVKRALDEGWPALSVVAVTYEVVRNAGAFAERFAVRGYDAVQLACYDWLRRSASESCRFLTFDERLAQAAEKLP